MGVRGATTRPPQATKSATPAMQPLPTSHSSSPPRARLRPPQGLLASPPSVTNTSTEDTDSQPLLSKTVEEEPVLNVAFRKYPFPPSRTPLSYPLPPSRPPDTTALPNISASSGALGLRKRILHRWRGEAAKKNPKPGHSSPCIAEADSHQSQRAVTNAKSSNRTNTRKRPRSPLPPDSYPLSASHPSDFIEGEPILSHNHAEFERTKYPRLLGTDGRYRKDVLTESSAPRPTKHPRDERSAYGAFRSERRGNGGPPFALIPLDIDQDEYIYTGYDIPAIGATSPHLKTRSDPQHDRVHSLRQRRRLLEEAELDEISRVATVLGTKNLTREERNQLKLDMERLSRQGVRDCLKLISRKMKVIKKVMQPGERIEVELPLDMLPADLLRELQVIVMHEKGQLRTPHSAQLDQIRSELQELARNSQFLNADKEQ